MAPVAKQQQDPVAVLNQAFREVLVTTGKVLQQISKDGSHDIHDAGFVANKKAQSSMTAFHHGLNDLESEIIRAKAVLLRDLEQLRAARAPIPPPVELPSAAAHTMSAPPIAVKAESNPVAPFPDMGGMDITSGVVDLTPDDNNSPTAQRGPGQSQQVPPRPTPPVKTEPKPSPKAAPKQTPPAKVTPVPPPQIPRLQPTKAAPAPTPAPAGPGSTGTPAQAPQPGAATQQPPPSQPPGQSPAMDLSQNKPPEAPMGAGTGAGSGGGGLNFTDMQFSLAPPPSGDSQAAAPPAPMADAFDLSSFVPQDGTNDLLSLGNLPSGGGPEIKDDAAGAGGSANNNPPSSSTVVPAPGKELENNNTTTTETNHDDLFNFGNGTGADNMDLDLDLSTGGVDGSSFDDLFIDTNDADNMQFNDAFFGLE